MSLGRRALIFLALVLTGCGSSGTRALSPDVTSPPVTAAPSTARPSPTLRPGVAQVIKLDRWSYGIAATDDALWVEGDFTIHHLDGATGASLGTLDGWQPRVTDGSLWYVRDDEVVLADAATGAERRAWSPPLIGTVVDEGILWTSDEGSGVLSAIDLRSGKVRHEVELPRGEVKWIEAWQGLIWVVIDGSGGVIVRVDPETAKVVDELDAGTRPHSVATGFGSLWVTDHGSPNLYRFAADGSLEATIAGPGVNVGITATEASIWAAGRSGVHEIDPATNTVLRTIELGSGDWYGLAASAGNLWLTTGGAGRLLQLPIG